MKNIIIGTFLVVIVIISTAFYFSGQKTATNQIPEFTLGVNTWVGYGPFWVAQEKGFYKDEGVEVKIVTIEDTAQRKAAMLKGDVDGLGDTVDHLVLERDENVPAVAVMQNDFSNGADGILVTDQINNIQDLIGKKVAVQRNFVSEAFLDYVLYKNAIHFKDVQKVDMEAGSAGAAFVAGKVDAAVTFEPWLSKAKERNGGGKVLISSADEPGIVVDILTVNEKYLQNNPEVVKKIMRGWFKAVDYWKSNPTDANTVMAKHYNLSVDEFRDVISGLIWPSYQENISYFDPNKNGKIWEVAGTFINVFSETKQIKSKPDMRKAINSDLIMKLYDK